MGGGGGLIIGRIFASVILGGGGGACFREGLFLEGLIIGILRYNMSVTVLSTEGQSMREKHDQDWNPHKKNLWHPG